MRGLVSKQITTKGKFDLLNGAKFFEWTMASLKREAGTRWSTLPLISSLRSGFYDHWEAAADGERPSALAQLYCHTQVFIRSIKRPGEGLFFLCVCVNPCGLCVFGTTNLPTCQMESALVQAFMGAKWWWMGQWSTLAALTFSSPLLTY